MNTNATVALAMAIFAAAQAASAAPADEWPMWQCGADHAGYQGDTLLFGARTFGWSQRARPGAITGLAASSTLVFTTDSATAQPTNAVATLGAQALVDGHPVWSVSFPSGTAISAPAYADGIVFFVENVYGGFNTNGTRFLDALDAATGQTIYRVALSLPGTMFDAPTPSGGQIYFESQTSPGTFSATPANWFGSASAASGQLEWQSNSAMGDGVMPTISGTHVYGYTTVLNVLDADSGVTDFSIANGAIGGGFSQGRAPIVVGSRAFMTQGGQVVAFDLAAQSVAWAKDTNASGQIATDGKLLFYLSAGALAVRAIDDGALQWGWEAPQSGLGNSGGLTDNMIVTKSHVILTDGIKTYFIDRMSHFLVGSYQVAGLIAYANDQVIIGDLNGNVTTFRVPSDEIFANSFE